MKVTGPRQTKSLATKGIVCGRYICTVALTGSACDASCFCIESIESVITCLKRLFLLCSTAEMVPDTIQDFAVKRRCLCANERCENLNVVAPMQKTVKQKKSVGVVSAAFFSAKARSVMKTRGMNTIVVSAQQIPPINERVSGTIT